MLTASWPLCALQELKAESRTSTLEVVENEAMEARKKLAKAQEELERIDRQMLTTDVGLAPDADHGRTLCQAPRL